MVAGTSELSEDKMERQKTEPIVVTVPKQMQQRLDAILALAESNKLLAKALNHNAIEIAVSNCEIHTTDCGIKIHTEQ
jgi:hypothetical protein